MIESLKSEPFKLSAAAFKVFTAIQAAIAAHNEAVEKIDEQEMTIQQSAGDRPLKSAEQDKLIDIQEARAALLPDELSILCRIRDEWFRVRQGERLRASEEAHAAVPATREKIKEQLVSIGYHAKTEAGYDAIPNDFFLRHPGLQAARRIADEMAAHRLQRGDEKSNDAEINSREEQLKALRSRRGRRIAG